MIVVRAVLAWLPMIVIAVANGTFRQYVLLRYFREPAARQISTVLLLALFAAYLFWISRRWPAMTMGEAVMRGALWLVLTLAFEFGMGAATGKSWSAMLAEYNIAGGKFWVLVPLWVAIAPVVFFRR